MTGERVEYLGARPTLEVRDVARSVAFYDRVFGWRVLTTTGDPPAFALLGTDRPLLAVSQERDPAVAAVAACFVEVMGVEALAARCEASGVEVVAPLTDHPWGMRDFVVRDPDGHLLALGEQVERRGLDL